MSEIVGYAVGKVGQKVGDGECTRLVEKALNKAGKKVTKDFGVVGRKEDYVWGLQITLNDAHPGDIIQFRNHVMAVTVRRADGGSVETTHARPHHTAIIASKNWREDSKKRQYYQISLLEQNQGGKKYVFKNTVQLENSLTVLDNGDEIEVYVSGEYFIYRPVNK